MLAAVVQSVWFVWVRKVLAWCVVQAVVVVVVISFHTAKRASSRVVGRRLALFL